MEKQGPAFGNPGKYSTPLYKSAGIVTQHVGNKLVAARIEGSYWMYPGCETSAHRDID